MKRGREHFKRAVSHGRFVKVNNIPPTWIEAPDDTPDSIIRERFQHRLDQQLNPPNKMKTAGDGM